MRDLPIFAVLTDLTICERNHALVRHDELADRLSIGRASSERYIRYMKQEGLISVQHHGPHGMFIRVLDPGRKKLLQWQR